MVLPSQQSIGPDDQSKPESCNWFNLLDLLKLISVLFCHNVSSAILVYAIWIFFFLRYQDVMKINQFGRSMYLLNNRFIHILFFFIAVIRKHGNGDWAIWEIAWLQSEVGHQPARQCCRLSLQWCRNTSMINNWLCLYLKQNQKHLWNIWKITWFANVPFLQTRIWLWMYSVLKLSLVLLNIDCRNHPSLFQKKDFLLIQISRMSLCVILFNHISCSFVCLFDYLFIYL